MCLPCVSEAHTQGHLATFSTPGPWLLMKAWHCLPQASSLEIRGIHTLLSCVTEEAEEAKALSCGGMTAHHPGFTTGLPGPFSILTQQRGWAGTDAPRSWEGSGSANAHLQDPRNAARCQAGASRQPALLHSWAAEPVIWFQPRKVQTAILGFLRGRFSQIFSVKAPLAGGQALQSR